MLIVDHYNHVNTWFIFVETQAKKKKTTKRQTSPHIPRTWDLECISASLRCLPAVCTHLPQIEEGHLIGGGFPYLPPAFGNLKYITRLVELYFKSLENR